METYISLLIEGLVFLVVLISAVGGVWAKLTNTIAEQDKRLVRAETELDALADQRKQDQDHRKTVYSRFDNLESEIGEIDKKVARIEAKIDNGHRGGSPV